MGEMGEMGEMGGGIITKNEGLIRYRKVFVQVLNCKKNKLLRFFIHWVLLVFLRAKKRSGLNLYLSTTQTFSVQVFIKIFNISSFFRP